MSDLRQIKLGSYLWAKEDPSGPIGLHCELLKVKQTIFLTPGDIQTLYETFCLVDKDPADLQNQEDEREQFLSRVWGKDQAHPK
jgi:hypothetical protein